MASDVTDKRTDKTDANKKKALEALRSTMGNITAACAAAGVNRQHFYTWRDNDPDFEQEVKNISESAIDMGETALMKQIQDGNTACIIFLLKTRGKNRGYIERVEVDHSGNIGITNGGDMSDEQFAALKSAAEVE